MLTTLLPGLSVAAVPALLTIAWQMLAGHREAKHLRSERLSQAFLNFRSEAEFLISLSGVADVHLGAVSKPMNLPAIWLGVLQPFDLTHFGDTLIEHTIRHFQLSNELMAMVRREQTRLLVKKAQAATQSLVLTYMPPSRPRGIVPKLTANRPSPKPEDIKRRRKEFNQAFDALAIALVPPRAWQLRHRWP